MAFINIIQIRMKIKQLFVIGMIVIHLFHLTNEQCSFGHFQYEKVCVQCPLTCAKCTTMELTCKSCSYGFIFNPSTSSCQNCRKGQLFCPRNGPKICQRYYIQKNNFCQPKCKVKDCIQCQSITSDKCIKFLDNSIIVPSPVPRLQNSGRNLQQTPIPRTTFDARTINQLTRIIASQNISNVQQLKRNLNGTQYFTIVSQAQQSRTLDDIFSRLGIRTQPGQSSSTSSTTTTTTRSNLIGPNSGFGTLTDPRSLIDGNLGFASTGGSTSSFGSNAGSTSFASGSSTGGSLTGGSAGFGTGSNLQQDIIALRDRQINSDLNALINTQQNLIQSQSNSSTINTNRNIRTNNVGGTTVTTTQTFSTFSSGGTGANNQNQNGINIPSIPTTTTRVPDSFQLKGRRYITTNTIQQIFRINGVKRQLQMDDSGNQFYQANGLRYIPRGNSVNLGLSTSSTTITSGGGGATGRTGTTSSTSTTSTTSTTGGSRNFSTFGTTGIATFGNPFGSINTPGSQTTGISSTIGTTTFGTETGSQRTPGSTSGTTTTFGAQGTIQGGTTAFGTQQGTQGTTTFGTQRTTQGGTATFGTQQGGTTFGTQGTTFGTQGTTFGTQQGGTTFGTQQGGTTSGTQQGGTTSGTQQGGTTFGTQGTTFGTQQGGTTFGTQQGGTTFGTQGTTFRTQQGTQGTTTFGTQQGGTTFGTPAFGTQGTTFGTQQGGTTSGTQQGGTTSGTQQGGTTFGTQQGGTTSGTQQGGTTSGTQQGGTTFGTQQGGTTFGTQQGGTTSGTQQGGTAFGTQQGGTTFGTQGTTFGTQQGGTTSGTQQGTQGTTTQGTQFGGTTISGGQVTTVVKNISQTVITTSQITDAQPTVTFIPQNRPTNIINQNFTIPPIQPLPPPIVIPPLFNINTSSNTNINPNTDTIINTFNSSTTTVNTNTNTNIINNTNTGTNFSSDIFTIRNASTNTNTNIEINRIPANTVIVTNTTTTTTTITSNTSTSTNSNTNTNTNNIALNQQQLQITRRQSDCKFDQFYSSALVCQKCSYRCLTCRKSKQQCLQCNQGFLRYGWKCIASQHLTLNTTLAVPPEKKQFALVSGMNDYKDQILKMLPESYTKQRNITQMRNLISVADFQYDNTTNQLKISSIIEKMMGVDMNSLNSTLANNLSRATQINELKLINSTIDTGANTNYTVIRPVAGEINPPTPGPSPSPKNNQNTENRVPLAAILVPSIVGGLCLLSCLLAMLCYCCRWCCFAPKSNPTSSNVWSPTERGRLIPINNNNPPNLINTPVINRDNQFMNGNFSASSKNAWQSNSIPQVGGNFTSFGAPSNTFIPQAPVPVPVPFNTTAITETKTNIIDTQTTLNPPILGPNSQSTARFNSVTDQNMGQAIATNVKNNLDIINNNTTITTSNVNLNQRNPQGQLVTFGSNIPINQPPINTNTSSNINTSKFNTNTVNMNTNNINKTSQLNDIRNITNITETRNYTTDIVDTTNINRNISTNTNNINTNLNTNTNNLVTSRTNYIPINIPSNNTYQALNPKKQQLSLSQASKKDIYSNTNNVTRVVNTTTNVTNNANKGYFEGGYYYLDGKRYEIMNSNIPNTTNNLISSNVNYNATTTNKQIVYSPSSTTRQVYQEKIIDNRNNSPSSSFDSTSKIGRIMKHSYKNGQLVSQVIQSAEFIPTKSHIVYSSTTNNILPKDEDLKKYLIKDISNKAEFYEGSYTKPNQ